MVFTERHYTVEKIATVTELAILLKCCCSPSEKGFSIENIFLLNDSADAESIQEFAIFILESGQWFQVDTLSVNLMNLKKLEMAISRLLTGTYVFKVPYSINIDIDDSEAL